MTCSKCNLQFINALYLQANEFGGHCLTRTISHESCHSTLPNTSFTLFHSISFSYPSTVCGKWFFCFFSKQKRMLYIFHQVCRMGHFLLIIRLNALGFTMASHVIVLFWKLEKLQITSNVSNENSCV